MKAHLFKSITLIGALIVFTAQAQTDTHREVAHELLDSMHLNQLLSESIDGMLELEIQNNPTLAPFKNTMRKFFAEYMSGESLRDDYVEMYIETFTESELRQLVDFYNTDVGQKSLRTAPELMAKGAALGQQRVMQNMQQLQYMIEEESKRLTLMQGN